MLVKVVFHNNNARTERGPFGEAYVAQVAQHAPLAAHCPHTALDSAPLQKKDDLRAHRTPLWKRPVDTLREKAA